MSISEQFSQPNYWDDLRSVGATEEEIAAYKAADAEGKIDMHQCVYTNRLVLRDWAARK